MQREKVTSPRPIRLPRSRLLDVTQRSPKRTFGGTLRDIQKTAAWETIGPLAAKNFPRTRTIEPARRLVLRCFRFFIVVQYRMNSQLKPLLFTV